MRTFVSRILLRDIPTYLMDMLERYIRKVNHWKNLRKLNPKLGGSELEVFDLGNCGPKNQFMVGNLIAHNCSYGAGPRKIHKTLAMQGVKLSLEQVQEMHEKYWEFYGGIKHYERTLKDEWRRNRGWVLNGIGRPIGVHRDFTKDLVNRVVQSTGHDILVEYCGLLRTGLDLAGIRWTPIVWDFHDEVLVEVGEEQAEAAIAVFREAQDLLNQKLGGTIPLRINPVLVDTFADAKLED